MMLLLSLGVIALTSIVIMYACDAFEEAADWLGRGMKPGVKGATINAIGSSLPELFTSFIFLFGPMLLPTVFGRAGIDDHFSAAIATTAGSAVFNAVIIPALCILAVTIYGVKEKGGRRVVEWISLNKRVVIKDGLFLISCELLLIYFLADSNMEWWAGGVLALCYLLYIAFTLGFGFEAGEGEDEEEEDEEEAGRAGLLGLGWVLDFNQRLFKGKPFTTGSAWTVLLAAVSVIGAACAGIVWGVEQSAEALGVNTYVTAVILAAAATSVPDTVLSVKDALKGEYDDAVANAVGSNIFDITVCLGFPLFIYGLVHGPVELVSHGGSAADVQALRWVLLAVTGGVLGALLVGKKIAKGKAIFLITLYALWTTFIIGRAVDAGWAQAIIEHLPA